MRALACAYQNAQRGMGKLAANHQDFARTGAFLDGPVNLAHSLAGPWLLVARYLELEAHFKFIHHQIQYWYKKIVTSRIPEQWDYLSEPPFSGNIASFTRFAFRDQVARWVLHAECDN